MRIKQSTIGAFAFAAYAAMSVILALSVLFIQSTLTTERHAVTQQAELKELARDLDESSDLLTQSCRRYVVTGEARHMRDYWAEIEVTRRREHVLERLEASGAPKDEFTLLERAKRQSDAIIPLESHAMRLVHEAKGISISEMPSLVAASTLSPAERALSPEGKMTEARRLLFAVDTEDAHNEIKSLIDQFERRGRGAVVRRGKCGPVADGPSLRVPDHASLPDPDRDGRDPRDLPMADRRSDRPLHPHAPA